MENKEFAIELLFWHYKGCTTKEACELIVDEYLSTLPNPVLSIKDLCIILSCKSYGLTLDDLKKRTRKLKILIPRQISMFMLRKLTKLSWTGISGIFDQDHVTAINSKKVIQNLYDTNKEYKVYLDALEQAIKTNTELTISHPMIGTQRNWYKKPSITEHIQSMNKKKEIEDIKEKKERDIAYNKRLAFIYNSF